MTKRSAIALAFVAALTSWVGASDATPVRMFDGKLFMAGGKYSVNENGTQRFIYRNDVWSMSPRTR